MALASSKTNKQKFDPTSIFYITMSDSINQYIEDGCFINKCLRDGKNDEEDVCRLCTSLNACFKELRGPIDLYRGVTGREHLFANNDAYMSFTTNFDVAVDFTKRPGFILHLVVPRSITYHAIVVENSNTCYGDESEYILPCRTELKTIKPIKDVVDYIYHADDRVTWKKNEKIEIVFGTLSR